VFKEEAQVFSNEALEKRIECGRIGLTNRFPGSACALCSRVAKQRVRGEEESSQFIERLSRQEPVKVQPKHCGNEPHLERAGSCPPGATLWEQESTQPRILENKT
jgi:hypothetical protein